jgi:hypothetical protein
MPNARPSQMHNPIEIAIDSRAQVGSAHSRGKQRMCPWRMERSMLVMFLPDEAWVLQPNFVIFTQLFTRFSIYNSTCMPN